jgi:hypothetical protein
MRFTGRDGGEYISIGLDNATVGSSKLGWQWIRNHRNVTAVVLGTYWLMPEVMVFIMTRAAA